MDEVVLEYYYGILHIYTMQRDGWGEIKGCRIQGGSLSSPVVRFAHAHSP